jgi:hypothetical protein
VPADFLFGDAQDFSVSYWVQYPNIPANNLNASTGTTYVNYVFPNGTLPIIGNAPSGFGQSGTAQSGWSIAEEGEPVTGGNPGAFFWAMGDQSSPATTVAGAAHSEDDGNWHHLVHTFARAGFGTTYLDGIMVNQSNSLAHMSSRVTAGTKAISTAQGWPQLSSG